MEGWKMDGAVALKNKPTGGHRREQRWSPWVAPILDFGFRISNLVCAADQIFAIRHWFSD
jgi:hypothetical protein